MATTDVIVLGRDDIGVIAEMTDTRMRYYLTECCGASAKGSMGTVVCRACYVEIDWSLGDLPDDGAIPVPFGDGLPYDTWKATR